MTRRLAVLLVFCTTLATAEGFIDGNELLRLLQTSGQPRSAGMLYVMGVADAVDRQRTKYKQCFAIPEKVTAGQMADVVQQFLEKNPSGRHFKAADLVASALEDAFPCPKL